MIKYSLIILLWITALSAKSIEIIPFIDYGYASSSMLFNFSAHFTENQKPNVSNSFTESRLTYPTNFYRAGGVAKIFFTQKNYISIGGWKNITQPSRYMSDTDWEGAEYKDGSILERVFASTNSSITVNQYGASIGIGRHVKKYKRIFNFSLLYQFEHTAFRVHGLNGWMLNKSRTDTLHFINTPTSNDPDTIYIEPDLLALTYNATYHTLIASLDFAIIKMWGFEPLRIGICGGPTFMEDKDTHPLRDPKTRSASHGWGYAVGGSLAMRYAPSKHFGFDIGVYPMLHYVKNELTQYHTSPDPITNIETTQEYSGFDNRVIYYNTPLKFQLILSL